MIIIISGTSSAGKSSIINEFPKNYNKISWDNIFEEFGYTFFQVCEYKNYKNKYYKQKEKDKFFYDCVYNKIINKLKKNKVNLIDIVDDFDEKNNPIVDSYLPSKIQILIYTDLDKLIDNMNKRKSYDPRSRFVFDQFAKYYVKTNSKNEAIDTINYNNFVKSLEKIKYEFESKKDLDKFAENIFKKMGINKITKDKNYYIKPRSNCYNLVLNTKGKSSKELKDEILKKII